ncbi:MAG TPA: hypothetical protein PLV13_03990 [Ilumatobacteraceae bacterium]|nr:hypothetical protein [Ilumatobacteraceae bacterium]
MPTSSLTRTLLLTSLLVIGPMVVACGGSGSATENTDGATTSAGSAASTSVSATTIVDTTLAGTTTTAVQQSKPKPGATTTTAASTTTAATLFIPPVTLKFGPTVTSASAKLTWTCAEANQAGHSAPVTWASTGASVVLSYAMPGANGGYPSQPANGTHGVTIVCGLTTTVTITPYTANGDKGTPRKLTITVGS